MGAHSPALDLCASCAHAPVHSACHQCIALWLTHQRIALWLTHHGDQEADDETTQQLDAAREILKGQAIGLCRLNDDLALLKRQRTALLAVAKATDRHNCECTDDSRCMQDKVSDTCFLSDAKDALDTAHPGWREWTP